MSKLPCTLHLNEHWEISLVSISVPKLSSSYLSKPTTFETSDRLAHIRIPREDDDEASIDEELDEEDLPHIVERKEFEIPLKPGDSGKIIIEKYLNPLLNPYNVKAFVNETGHCQLEGVKGHVISFSAAVRKLLGWSDDLFIQIVQEDGIVISPHPIERYQPSFFHVECDVVVNGVINAVYKQLIQANLPLENDKECTTLRFGNEV